MRRNYKYDIGDKVQCKDGSYHTIIERTTGNRGVSAYVCKCEKGHLHKKNQVAITGRCPYCINFKVAKGINDISTTNKEMFALIKDKEFAYTHHDSSPEMTEFICPLCGYSIERSPLYVKQNGFRCPHCSGGYSYGERFMMNFLDSLNIKHITQYSSKNAKWCGRYRYDFYLKDYDYIIEVHGMQHYKNTSWHTYQDIRKNDIDKMNLANNYVSRYIVLDTRKSELEYIKQSILGSELNDLLCLSKYNINWVEIQEKTVLPMLKEIADKYNNYSKNISELSKIFHCSNPTIVYYLKEAALLNMCDYDPEEKRMVILQQNHANNSEIGSKPLMCVEDSRVFRNARLLQRLSDDLYSKHLDYRAISAVCNGKRHTYKSLHFKFITREEFNRTKDISPELAFGDSFCTMKEVS